MAALPALKSALHAFVAVCSLTNGIIDKSFGINGYGFDILKSSVTGSTTSIKATVFVSVVNAIALSLMIGTRSTKYLTSSAADCVPSFNLTPCLSLNLYVK